MGQICLYGLIPRIHFSKESISETECWRTPGIIPDFFLQLLGKLKRNIPEMIKNDGDLRMNSWKIEQRLPLHRKI